MWVPHWNQYAFSILEAISAGLGGYIAGLEEVPTKHFSKDEIRVVLEKQGEGSFNKRYMVSAQFLGNQIFALF